MFAVNFDLPRGDLTELVIMTVRASGHAAPGPQGNRKKSNPMWLVGVLSIFFSAMPAIAQEADLVLRGGKVVTVDDSGTVAEAVAVVGNRIAAVGSTEAIEAYIGSGTRIVELNGRTLLPGFIDAHNHVEGSAVGQFFRLPVAVPPLETAEEVLEKVRRRASELPPGTWIEGQGTYYQPMPTREQLDMAIPDHPVVIRWSAHDVIANSKAMEMSGIDRNTPDPAGGHIERGPDGEPTGVFRDARQLLDLPQPSYEDKLRAIPLTLRELWLENGVTSVYTMDTLEGVRALQELRRRDELPPVRLSISFMLGDFDLDALISMGLQTGFGDEWLKIGAIKILFDGVWGTTAATYEPHYGTTDNYGNLSRTGEQLREEVLKAHAAGWQIWIHCNGPRAQTLALDAFEAALERYPRPDHRHRIEHFANFHVDDKILDRMERLGVIPVPQASFIWRTTDELLYQEGRPRLYILRTLIERGFRPPGNADSVGTQPFSINPMFSFTRAVLRTSKFGSEVDPDEAISVMDAIRMHTIWAARSGFEEDIKGSIEPGKLADMVVLSKNPLSVSPDDLMSIQAMMTIVDGRIVFVRNSPEPTE